MPANCAITPPRSISPIKTTGIFAASAKPMLAISPSRRLISAGLPAPSMTTKSTECAMVKKDSSTFGSNSDFKDEYSLAFTVVFLLPCTTTWAPISVSGFNKMGFICTVGSRLHAIACKACARPISPPSIVTAALFDIF